MPTLELKPTHKVVTACYDSLAKSARLGIRRETAVGSAFQELLESCARRFDWKLVPEYPITRKGKAALNRNDDEEYVVSLIGKVITVGLETLKVIGSFPKVF